MPSRAKRPLLGGLLAAPFICACLALTPTPAPSAEILLLHRDNDASSARIASLLAFLQSEGHNVTDAQRADGPDADDATTFDLVIVARSSDSGAYDEDTEPQDWNALPIPIINMSPYTMRNTRWGWIDGEDIPLIESHLGFDPYPDLNHPFLEGLAAPETTIFTTATTIRAAQNARPPGTLTVATYTYNAAVSDGIFVIPAGATMFNGLGTAGADRVGFLRGGVGSWDNIGSNGAKILRNMIAIYSAPPADSDMDGLNDDFEQLIIDADPLDAIDSLDDVLPGDDFDTDDLTNQQEHDRAPRTDPTNPDSDGDNIKDGHEDSGSTNPFEGGVFDNLPPGDPTDPWNADSDGDTISDFDEIDASNGSVTDPNNTDTDGDGFADGLELNRGGDPVDPDIVPELGDSILVIGDNAAGTSGADENVIAFLEDRYGADKVFYRQASQTGTAQALAFGTLLISSTIDSADGRGKFHDSPVPVVTWEEALAGNGAGDFQVSGERVKETAESHTITITQIHPITAGFSVGQDVVIADTETEVWWSTGQQAPDALSMAEKKDDPASGYITIVDEGGVLNDGSSAPGRRVMFGITDGTFNALTDDGKTLFGQAVDWALAGGSAREPLRITDITYSRTTAPDNIVVSITFTSQEGKFYTLFRSDNFDDPADIRPDVRDDIPGAVGATTTTYSVDFAAESIPIDTAVQFFVVKENS